MDVLECYGKIDAHADLSGIGMNFDEQTFAVQCNTSGQVTEVPLSAVEDCEWDIIESVLIGEREPQAMRYITRVCGYYSSVDNWNESKKGEFIDRHAGNYTLEESAFS